MNSVKKILKKIKQNASGFTGVAVGATLLPYWMYLIAYSKTLRSSKNFEDILSFCLIYAFTSLEALSLVLYDGFAAGHKNGFKGAIQFPKLARFTIPYENASMLEKVEAQKKLELIKLYREFLVKDGIDILELYNALKNGINNANRNGLWLAQYRQTRGRNYSVTPSLPPEILMKILIYTFNYETELKNAFEAFGSQFVDSKIDISYILTLSNAKKKILKDKKLQSCPDHNTEALAKCDSRWLAFRKR